MGILNGNFEGEMKHPEQGKVPEMSLEAQEKFKDLFRQDYDFEREGIPDPGDIFDEVPFDLGQLFSDDYKPEEADGEAQKEADAEEKEQHDADQKEAEPENKEEKQEAANDAGAEQKDKTEHTDDAKDDPEYDEDGTRELTEDEKQFLKEKLGWSDKKINDKCRIDKEGVIHYKTDCQRKEGSTAECGVPYERKTIVYRGVKIEGVFPVFESKFDVELDEADYQSPNGKQFSECNEKLKEAVEKDPDLRKQFTEEQLEYIKKGKTPPGYTWHHTEEPGKMQLVKTEDHDKTIGGAAHTGGNSMWGYYSVDRTGGENEQKGETF